MPAKRKAIAETFTATIGFEIRVCGIWLTADSGEQKTHLETRQSP